MVWYCFVDDCFGWECRRRGSITSQLYVRKLYKLLPSYMCHASGLVSLAEDIGSEAVFTILFGVMLQLWWNWLKMSATKQYSPSHLVLHFTADNLGWGCWHWSSIHQFSPSHWYNLIIVFKTSIYMYIHIFICYLISEYLYNL